MSQPDRLVQIDIPSSKSLTHRALLLAACSHEECLVKNPLWGHDTTSTLHALRALGASAVRDDHGNIQFSPSSFSAAAEALDCGNSGTTLRLLIGLCARLENQTKLTGDQSLSSRPNAPLLEQVEKHGATVSSNSGRLPISIQGPLSGGPFSLPAMVSSQYASGLILSLPFLEEDSTLHMEGPIASRPYLDLTLDMATLFGLSIKVEEQDDSLLFRIKGGQQCKATSVHVEGDWSTAAFPLVAGSISNTAVALSCLNPNSKQGDRAIAEILARFGQSVRWDADRLILEPAPLKNPGHVDISQTPDVFPALCILAACTPGETRIDGAPHLRDKECDRIQAMHEGFEALGITSSELPDGIVVHGGQSVGGEVHDFHDHRIHMAFSVLNLVSKQPVVMENVDCVAVSYPEFHEHLMLFKKDTPS